MCPGWFHRHVLAALMLAACSRLVGPACSAQQPPANETTSGDEPVAENLRLFEQPPHDLIRLPEPERAEFRVLPIYIDGKRIAQPPAPKTKLVVRLMANPTQDYELTWPPKAELLLFEQRVLEEALRLTAAGQFDEAYDYYAFLWREAPEFPGVRAAVDAYALADSQSLASRGQFDLALGVLSELHLRSPRHPELPRAFAAVADKLVTQHVERGDPRAARQVVSDLEQRFPNDPAVAEIRARLRSMAEARLAEAKTYLSAQQYVAAQTGALTAFRLDAGLTDARAIAEEAFHRFPRVDIGVTSPSPTTLPVDGAATLVHAGIRRTQRLVARGVQEFVGFGPSGSEYASPFGEWRRDDAAARIHLRIRPGQVFRPSGQPLTGQQLAGQLLAMAETRGPHGQHELAAWLESVEVRDPFTLDLTLRRPHPRPEALFTWPPVCPWSGEEFGSFTATTHTSDSVVFRTASHDEMGTSRPPREIVEHSFADARSAMAALRQLKIVALAEVAPADVAALRADERFVVESYAVPSVHCLVPNPARPLLRNRTFCRALVYGVDRADILRRQILKDREIAGCAVVSGPFPVGIGRDDPAAYAYNREVLPRPYEPRLALALSAVGRSAAAVDVGGKKTASETTRLVLSHPPRDVPRLACRAIQRQWRLLGIEAVLRERSAEEAQLFLPEDDLAYLELTMNEPLVDARRLLGPTGLLGRCSPYMRLALDQLDAAESLADVRPRLHEIHRLAHEEVAVLPLWQLLNFFAYHKSLSQVGTRPATLYQNVDRWSVMPPFDDKPTAGKQ